MRPGLFAHVLVPHDFSAAADAALHTAAELARSEAGRVSVVHAITPFSPLRTLAGPEAQSLDAQAIEARVRDRLEARVASVLDGRTVPCTVTFGNPGQRIAAAAADATCVVMPTHARTGAAHALMGSVAQRVLQLSPVPVLVIPPPRAAAPRAARPRPRRRRAASPRARKEP